MNDRTNLSVAIIQPYIPHYRVPVFNLLSRQKLPAPEYTLFAATKAGIHIKTSNIEISSIPPEDGGLTWRFTKCYWLGQLYIWQTFNISLAMSKNFDTIIYPGYMYDMSTWISVVIARLTGKRTLMWTHGFVKKEKGIKGWIRRKFYQLADGYLLYGYFAKNIMIRYGFKPDDLYVVYNSLDYAMQCTVRNNLSNRALLKLKGTLFLNAELPVIIFIGRLTLVKKLDMIIDAIKKLEEDGLYLNMLFVGTGPALDQLQERAEKIKIASRVVFYGACYNEDELGPLISMGDICVSPGEIGLTCIHSLTYGTPVITHDNPDCQMPEWEAIVPGKSGALFKQDDVNDLASVIANWVRQKRSRDAIRKDCQEIVDRYYNPQYQVSVINAAVVGTPSTDLAMGKLQ